MIRVLSVALLALVCLPAPKASARCPLSESNPQAVIDFTTWQSQMEAVEPRLERGVRALLAAKVGSKVRVHRVIGADHRTVASWDSCERGNCRGGVAFFNSNPEKLRFIRRAILPHNERVGSRSGKAFRVLHTVVEDIDHDGDDELLVHYEVDGPRRATSGVQVHEYMAIFNLPNLRLQLFFRLGRHGGGDLQEFCSWKVTRRDFNCDRRTDLLIEQECGMNICFEADAPERDCRNQPKAKKWHLYWQAETDTYSGKRGYARVQFINDDRPYVVIAGSFAVQGTGYLARAKKLRSKLVKAGFEDTMIHNSREFPALACCYRTVVAGRFAQKADAVKLQQKLKQGGFRPYVRKGF